MRAQPWLCRQKQPSGWRVGPWSHARGCVPLVPDEAFHLGPFFPLVSLLLLCKPGGPATCWDPGPGQINAWELSSLAAQLRFSVAPFSLPLLPLVLWDLSISLGVLRDFQPSGQAGGWVCRGADPRGPEERGGRYPSFVLSVAAQPGRHCGGGCGFLLPPSGDALAACPLGCWEEVAWLTVPAHGQGPPTQQNWR